MTRLTMNVPVSKLAPGTFGLSRGGGMAGELVRHATESEFGHAFLYLGGGQIIQGQPPAAGLARADSHRAAIWAWRMWDQLAESGFWGDKQIATAQAAVVARGRALVGTPYDYGAYVAFSLEVLHLRNAEQLAGSYEHDPSRVCSGLVADALKAGAVPLEFDASDGPGLTADPSRHFMLPPALVSPGMLAGLAIRKNWL